MSKHHVMTDHAGTSSIESLPTPPFAAAEHAGWESLSHEAAGVFLFMFKIAPGAAEYPMHAAPDAFLGYVATGSGELFSGDGDGEKRGSAAFTAGDFITFQPNTQHAWKNGPEETRILFLKPAS